MSATLPDIAALAEEDRRAMLARLLSHQAEGPQSFPLSFAQERLWFLDRLSPANPAYNIPGAFRLTGPLDKGALEAALNDVVARHHTLRTVFGQNGGKPVQTVLPTLAVPLWLATIDGNTAEDRQQMVARLIDAELCRPFDLSQGPLLRASLFPLGPADHVLLVVIHHIAADGWSLGLFNRDLEHAYAARKAGFPSTLAPLTTTYADYAAWQRTALTGERQEHLLRFWRERMADLPALDLPLDRPRPPLQSYRGGAVDIALDGTLVAAAERLARDLDTTPYCVLLAAFELMLARLSGQQDFAVGSPVANRGHPESETQIGFFVNTLALRSSIGGARVFRDLVQRITAATRAAHAHQDIPFEQLVEQLAVARDTSRMPLVQVFFALQNAPMRPLVLDGIAVSPFPYTLSTARFDLELHLWNRRHGWTGVLGAEVGMVGTLVYGSDLFDRKTAAAMAGMYIDLLRSALANPAALLASLSALPLLAREDQSATDRPATSAVASLPAMIDAARQAFATRPALRGADGRCLDYAGLFGRADALLAGLTAAGIRSGDRLGLLLGRGADLACAMLSAERGALTFVPIDPALPPERLRRLTGKAGLRLLLTADDEPVAGEVPTATVAALVAAGGAAPADGGLRRDRPSGVPLYIVFTSGSTGEPKAVAMPESAFANLIGAQARSLPTARVTLQASAIGFDVAIQEVFQTLATGGLLVPLPEADRRDPTQLACFVRDAGIERLYMPFTLLRMLAEAALTDGIELAALREVITAGEQPRIDATMRQFFAQNAGACLVNQYGPAETHVVTEHVLAGDSAGWPEFPPAGMPLPGNTLHILDPGGSPLPVGLAGELYIGGVQLADGYADDPALSADRFSRDRLGVRTGRLYRTGDRARLSAAGVLHFLGRCDRQVKIRGYRIEPSEVEAALAALPGVGACAVVAEPEADGGLTLAAYLVPAGDNEPPPTYAGLRDLLRGVLAEYMVPSRFALVSRIPQNANGKVDRTTLKSLSRPLLPSTQPGSARTDEQRIIAEAWCAVLGREAVGTDETFFDAGGNSLLIIQLQARLGTMTTPPLSVSDLFQYPTVAALASFLRQRIASAPAAATCSPVFERANRQRRLQGHAGP